MRDELGERVALVLDGGACPLGIESTVVDMTGGAPAVLRPGAVLIPAIIAGLGVTPDETKQQVRCYKSPGMMERHYAPSKPLRLNARDIKPGEALLAFGAPLPGAVVMENLSPSENLEEAAANLFAMLRRLDDSRASGIAVMPIAENGLGIAINDRLKRAAANP